MFDKLMTLRDFRTIKARKNYIGKIRGISLSAIDVYPQDLENAQKGNCENMIGAVQVPLGVAGPLTLQGTYAQGDYYIPLATTEAALVASVNRGCKAITMVGGAKVHTEYVGVTRGSVFTTKGLTESLALKCWLVSRREKLSQIVTTTSSHLHLLDLHTVVAGRNVYVRFSFDSQDAMGMNMATVAVDKLADFIQKQLDVHCLALAGNFDIDKKPAWLNFILGRGRKVWAEVVIGKNIIEEVLKTSPEEIHKVAIEKCLLGGALSGTLGFNAHFANIVAALFIATGQDVAHTVEGSLGITTTDVVDGQLAIAVNLPDLLVGTVGGGTVLPAQKEALSLLGISGGGRGINAACLAEIVGGAVLAGELSLLAAITSGSLASSHQKLRRKMT